MRTRITWLIGGAVVVLLVVAGVDALRSGRSEASPPASLTDILSPAAPTESSTQITPADTSETPVAETSTESFQPPPPPMHITAQGGTPRHAKYARAALAVCASATSELFRRASPELLRSAGWTDGRFSLEELDNIWQWNSVAAKMETRSLRRLKSLPAPQAERKLIGEFFQAAEDERDLLRKVAGQAAKDYPELLRILARKREDATHVKDEVVARIAARWHLDPESLQVCPLMLPA